MNNNWNYPTSVRVGGGRRDELPGICESLGMRSPLLVTDPGLAGFPTTQNMIAECRGAGLDIEMFSDVKPNPTGTNVENGVKVYCEGNHDSVIALGGGSGLDAGKAIAAIANQTCSLWDLEDIGDNWLNADAEKIPPIIGIPTTAGTGSEVGRASVILNEQEMKKAIIFHPDMLPKTVILDPELTIGLPPHLTAATGMDALSHSLEAYSSPLYHPMAEGIAIEGIRLVKENLPAAVETGTDIEARMEMLVASAMGATAFQRGLGAMHALAHPLGALYDAHHGLLNAILMPYVLKANRHVIEKRVVRLANYLDLPASFDGFLDWILELRVSIGIQNTLLEIGINTDRVEEIGHMAVADPSASTNPIQFTAAEYSEILTSAIGSDS
ncbi:MAG: iron-containing alcohol dehydrogenase [Pseudomonadota bacterium]